MATHKVGVLIPAPNIATEPELARHLSDEYSVHTSRMHWTRGGEEAMLDEYLPLSVRDLAAMQPDVVVFACTTGGAVRGTEYEKNLVQWISEQTSAPAISVMAESMRSLKDLGAQRIGVLTPYPEEDNVHIKASLMEAGFDVPVIDGLRIPGVKSPDLSTDQMIEFGKGVLAGHDIDAVFISCTNLFTLDSLPDYEAAFGKPVVTTLSATIDAIHRTFEP